VPVKKFVKALKYLFLNFQSQNDIPSPFTGFFCFLKANKPLSAHLVRINDIISGYLKNAHYYLKFYALSGMGVRQNYRGGDKF
jgi:hypothetical protein